MCQPGRRPPAGTDSSQGEDSQTQVMQIAPEAQQHHKECPELLLLLIVIDEVRYQFETEVFGTSLPAHQAILLVPVRIYRNVLPSQAKGLTSTSGNHWVSLHAIQWSELPHADPDIIILLSMSQTFVQDLTHPIV